LLRIYFKEKEVRRFFRLVGFALLGESPEATEAKGVSWIFQDKMVVLNNIKF